MCRTADDYDVLQNLYSGKASELHAAQCKLSHMTVALKKYRKDKLSELNWHQVLLSCLVTQDTF